MAAVSLRKFGLLTTAIGLVYLHATDRDNCIVLKIDTQMTSVQDCSPFGFHFELDKKRYHERKKQIRRQSEFHLFYVEDLKETIVLMQGIIAETTVDVINITLSYNGTTRDEKLTRLLK
ncbi:hypothetical protein OSTOST_06605, partial [Ostertagia ostertagi]